MTLALALQRIETELTALGLTRYAYRLDQDTLEEATGRGSYDDSYHLRILEGPSPLREMVLVPTIWVVVVEIQIATEVKSHDDRTPADAALGAWYAKVQRRLVWGSFAEIWKFFEQSRATSLTRDGQRLVTACRFEMTYEET